MYDAWTHAVREDMTSVHRLTGAIAVALSALVALPSPAAAADQPFGHRVTVSRYAGTPTAGKSFKLKAKASTDGNAATFALPTDPTATPNSITVARDGGILSDALTGGTWRGMGNPAGSKGWKYTNKAADPTAPVKVLLIKDNLIKLVTRGTGTMPAPLGGNGDLQAILRVGDERYCTLAASPHSVELDGRVVRTRKQPPPASCPAECTLGTDTDGDRLDDCYETDTGVFVSDFDTGSDPGIPDTDDDGLLDGDETLGTLAGLDLPSFGVNPLHKDVLVEYDWFDDAITCGSHSHRPSATTLALVTDAFNNAPVANPDGTTGIHFIHDRGQGGVFSSGSLIPDADGILVGGVFSPEFIGYRSEYFDPSRHGYFHYTILPHHYGGSTSSGQAEFPGDDMIVSLGCAIANSLVANTIVHEIGHNFLLGHGGGDHCNYKPNYNSVMNYRYQFPGTDNDCTPPANGVLSYSIGDRVSLDENGLDENEGICGAPPWDWNGNSLLETGVVLDLNSADVTQGIFCGGTLTTLVDHDDWANLRIDLVSPFARAFAPSEVIDCTNTPPSP